MAVCDLIRIEMECECNIPRDNMALVATGSIFQLGNWNINEGLIAEEVPKNSGKWVVGFTVPSDVEFEWKFVIVRRDTLVPFLWEDISNRQAHITQNGRFLCNWNGEAVFQPVVENSGFVLHQLRIRELVKCLEEKAERLNRSHGERPQSSGILYRVFHYIKSGIINVCSWLWNKIQSFFWYPPQPPQQPPSPQPQEHSGTWVSFPRYMYSTYLF